MSNENTRIRAALYRPGASGYELIEQPKNQDRRAWYQDVIGSPSIDTVALSTDVIAYYGGGLWEDYNRHFTTLSVALANGKTPVTGPVLIVRNIDEDNETSLTVDDLALLDAAAREPDAVAAPFFSLAMRTTVEPDWSTLTVAGAIPSVLPTDENHVPGAALMTRKRQTAFVASARWEHSTYIGNVGDATVSVGIKLRPAIHGLFFDHWLLYAANDGGTGVPSPEELVTARDHARTFLDANSADLGKWWDLSNHIDLHRAEMRGTDALSLAAGGLDLGLVVRYAKLGVSDPELVREAIANDIPDEFVSAM